MMLRHWLHTFDADAARRWLVPVAVQTMTFFEPVMRAVLRNPEAWNRFSRILEHRGSIEYLCRTIEALENERLADEKDETKDETKDKTKDETKPDA